MTDETVSLRRCIGSARFGIEPHEAPLEDFPHQPSQKDGLGRMCRTHWNAYTAGLAREAKARKAEAGEDVATSAVGPETVSATDPASPEPEPARKRRGRGTSPTPVVGAQGDPG